MKVFIDRPLTISFTTTIAMIGEIRDIMISLINQTDGITVTIIKEWKIRSNIPLTIIREITTRQMFRVISRQPPFLPKTKGEMFSRTPFLPVTTTPSSVELPRSGTITPQILDQTKVTRYERVPELARSTLKEGAIQAIILQFIANLKSSSYHPYHHTEMVHHLYEWTLLDRFQNLYSNDVDLRKECLNWKTWTRENFIAHLERLVSPEGKAIMSY